MHTVVRKEKERAEEEAWWLTQTIAAVVEGKRVGRNAMKGLKGPNGFPKGYP